ncbi:MAG: PHB depolymerase family esterase [Myxococcota bacterium]
MRSLSWVCVAALLSVGCGDDGANSGTGGTAGSGGSGGGSDTGGSPGTATPWILDSPIDETRRLGEREYVLYVPSGLDLNEPTPLVFSFHGSTPGEGGASTLQRGVSGGNAHAQDNGYIIVYPQGLVRNGNQGWDTTPLSPDIDFVDAMIAELDDEFGLDDDRVYSAGISNGGSMSYALACVRGEVFAAIGPVATGLPAECPLIERVPAIVFHGTDDEFVSFDRGSTSAEAWAMRNGCGGETVQVFENGDSVCDAFQGCLEAGDTEFCTIDGGGHTWPGSPFADIFDMFGAGATTMDLDATDRMWRFFEAHPK